MLELERSRASLDISASLPGDLLSLKELDVEDYYLPVVGECYLLSNLNCLVQMGHNYVGSREG